EPNVAGCSRPVLDDERATELHGEPVSNQPSMDVVRAAGRKTNNKAHRPGRIDLRPRNPRDCRQRAGTRCQLQKLPAGESHIVHRWFRWAGDHAVARTTRAEPSRARGEVMSLSAESPSLSAVEMRRRIGTKEISPVELVEASIARIEALNPAVNAIAAADFAHARKLAISAESAARKGEQLGPLHGLPTGIKDLHETAGLL